MPVSKSDCKIERDTTMKEWFLHYKEAIRVSLLALFRWTLLAVCTGVLCGGIGTLFHLAVEWVTEQRAEQVWLLWLLPAAGIAITALYKATGCVGKGTNDVLRAVQDGSSVTPWLVPAIFLGTVLTHLCGGSAGREGAALQMGGSIGWNIGRVLHFNNHDCRTATVCGMAAFFSALFGTPLTATLFAMMVVDVGLMLTVAFVPGFLAALIAYGISLKAGIAPTRFVMEAPPLDARTVVRTAVLAMCCAVVAVIFCQMLHFFEHEIPKLLPNPWMRAAAGGAAVVALSYLMGVGRYNGAGMDVIMDAVELEQALPWDFVCKMVLTVLTLSVGFKGGEVVPSFYIGATFGCVVGPLLGLPAGFSACPFLLKKSLVLLHRLNGKLACLYLLLTHLHLPVEAYVVSVGEEYVQVVVAVPVLLKHSRYLTCGIAVVETFRMGDVCVVCYTSVLRHFLMIGGEDQVSLIMVA